MIGAAFIELAQINITSNTFMTNIALTGSGGAVATKDINPIFVTTSENVFGGAIDFESDIVVQIFQGANFPDDIFID